MKPILIKICGLTRLEDCLQAADCGADWLGFVFHPASPRFVSPTHVQNLLRQLRQSLASPPETVGVFVDQSPDQVQQTLTLTGIDRAQLHGNERAELYRALGLEVLQAFRPASVEEVDLLPTQFGQLFLVDTYDPDRYGGTGRPLDWDLARRAARRGSMILAGGLKPDTVHEALVAVRPRGVDVSSGVESRPGVKDPEKIQKFIQEVRRWESRIPKDTSDPMEGSSSPKP